MHPAYDRIFRELTERYRVSQTLDWRYPWPHDGLESMAVVTEAIERSVGELEPRKELRPDARLFLFVNLHQLVTLPISHPNSPISLDEVRAGVREDAGAIIRAAGESAGDRNDIPASHVLWGTAKVLDKLNLKNWRLWERE